MFKRANKVTALLVAAAAVVSLVPASAANAATRLGTKEGTIESAIAFKDGKYIYEGYKTDDDNKSIYFNAGEKDKELEEVQDADSLVRYGEKYAYMVDGGDQYLVDLTSGKVVDDETPEDKADNANSKVRSALKKTDRYGKISSVDLNEESLITANQFGENWYSYSATPADGADGCTDAVDGKLYGFTNESGKYIDACKLANIYAYSTERKKIVKIEKFNDDDKDAELKVDLKKQPRAIAQDKNYIYAVVDVTITDTSDKVAATKASLGVDFDKITTGAGAYFTFNGEKIDTDMHELTSKDEVDKKLKAIKFAVDAAGCNKDLKGYKYDDKTHSFVCTTSGEQASQPGGEDFKGQAIEWKSGAKTGTAKTVDATYLQKISKSQGEKEDEAYLPKSVDSYQLDNKSLYDNGDVNDAYTAVLKDDDGFEEKDNQYRVKDNTLYVTRTKSDKVKIFKLKMKKIKENPIDGVTVDDETKLDGYVVKKDGDSDQDVQKGTKSVSVDVDGNTWCINEGKIYKFNGTDKKEMFTCDRSLDTLSVYNEGSLIAWEDGEDVYTTVQEGKAEVEKDVTPAKNGWVNTAAGWTFYDGAGKQVIGNNKWVNAGGVWYMIKADGIMATGWFNDNGTWYFLDTTSGAMKTGWLNANGTWYYMQSSGAMKTGWLNDNGTWYYLNANGSMAANTTVDGYNVAANGAWIR